MYIATHEAVGSVERPDIRVAGSAKAAEAHFMVLHDGRIYFERTVMALRASQDSFLRQCLNMTLPPWVSVVFLADRGISRAC